MSEKVKIGIAQLNCSTFTEVNTENTLYAIKKLAKRGANIICLQELYRSIYFPYVEKEEYFDLAESIPGPSSESFQKLSRELGVTIIASLFEKRTKGLYHNTTIVCNPDSKELGIYRKMHIPDDPGFYEKYYFTPGDQGYKAFDTPFGKIGVLICWDQWYPEAARLTALQGAEIIFYPTAIGWELEAEDHVKKVEYQAWRTMMRSHAIANGTHVVAVNRCGHEHGTEFWGGSFVSDPFGKVLFNAPFNKESMKVIEVDLSDTEKYRRTWPFLRDRRVDSYSNITKRFSDDS